MVEATITTRTLPGLGFLNEPVRENFEVELGRLGVHSVGRKQELRKNKSTISARPFKTFHVTCLR